MLLEHTPHNIYGEKVAGVSHILIFDGECLGCITLSDEMLKYTSHETIKELIKKGIAYSDKDCIEDTD